MIYRKEIKMKIINRNQFKLKIFLEMTKNLAKLSTCSRRQVGCIILDKDFRIIASGYNGVKNKASHCNQNNCLGANYSSGTNLDKCEAIHAEQNALLQCQDINKIHTIISTTAPCIHCAKLISNTSCKKVAYSSNYFGTCSGYEYLTKCGIDTEFLELIEE